MIRRSVAADFAVIESIINEAAQAYRGVIPPDRWHEPYMTAAALQAEIEAGVDFWGWEESGVLKGVMGIQQVRDATLIRHAYVRTAEQGRGIGAALLTFLISQRRGALLVGHVGRGWVGHPFLRTPRVSFGAARGERPAAHNVLEYSAAADRNLGGVGLRG